MARGRTNRVMVTRVRGGEGSSRAPDRVVVEEPMEIRLDDHLVTTTMRTPGHDYELAVGFLFTEGLLGGASVSEVRYCATGSAVETEFNVVSVSTGGRAPVPEPRLTPITASCGICGATSIDDLADRLRPNSSLQPLDFDVVRSVAGKALGDQELFGLTGAVHAAASYDIANGEVRVVREDVGRHNAVDKLIGRMVLDAQLPAGNLGLFVSGRVSFEIVQKAWAAGFAQLVAVSAPTALAVDTARRANIALGGFLRGDGVNVYVP